MVPGRERYGRQYVSGTRPHGLEGAQHTIAIRREKAKMETKTFVLTNQILNT